MIQVTDRCSLQSLSRQVSGTYWCDRAHIGIFTALGTMGIINWDFSPGSQAWPAARQGG